VPRQTARRGVLLRAVRSRQRSSPARLLSVPSRISMWAGITVGLLFFLVFGVAPVAGNILVSFTNYSGLAGSPTSLVGWSNYTQLLTTQRPGFISSLTATAIFVGGVTVVQNALGLALAHRLQHEGRVNAVLRMLAFTPVVLGVTIVGLTWLVLFSPSDSPASSFFALFGVHSAFFGSTTVALPLLIVVLTWEALGFTMVVFIGGLKTIPRDLYEAADVDGVTAWRRFRSITWPLMAPTVTVNVLFAVIGTLTTYNIIYVLTDGEFNTDTLGMLAFNSAFGASADLGFGAAVTTVLLVITVLVAVPLAALLRYRERRLFA
jgi:multiple sugar transport system permease protein